jgi:hypothetical protein
VSRQRLLVAINLALALALGAWVWSRLQPRLPTDARRDLLLDAARVELLEGFDDLDQLLAWSDEKRTNPDRTEIALPVRRDCKLEWRVEARPGASRWARRACRSSSEPTTRRAACASRCPVGRRSRWRRSCPPARRTTGSTPSSATTPTIRTCRRS